MNLFKIYLWKIARMIFATFDHNFSHLSVIFAFFVCVILRRIRHIWDYFTVVTLDGILNYLYIGGADLFECVSECVCMYVAYYREMWPVFASKFYPEFVAYFAMVISLYICACDTFM